MVYRYTPRDIAALMITTLLWASSFPLIKLGLEYFPPIMMGGLRYFIGSLPIVIFLVLRKGTFEETKKLFRNYWKFIIGVGVFMVTIPNITQNVGMLYTTASLATLIQSVGPVFVVILAIFLLNETPSLKKYFGAGVALTCSVLLVVQEGIELGNMTLYGNFLQLVTAISYALNGLIGKLAVNRITPIVLVGWSMFVGSIILFPISLATETQDWIPALNTEGISVLIFLAIGPALIATFLWYVVLQKQEVSKQILFIYLLPFFAIIFSYILLDEIINFITIILGVLTIIGVAIAQETNKRGKKGFFLERKGVNHEK